MAETERTVDFLPLVNRRPEQEDRPMFSVHCPTHGTDVLLSERRISSIEPTDGAHRLHWRCWCGTEGVTDVPLLDLAASVGRYRPAV